MGAVDNSVAPKGRARVDLQVKYRCDEIFAPGEKTTLMLRGIPRSFTEEDLIRHIERVAGGQCFDFIYLPWDTKRNANMGFAFVNCVEPRVAHELLNKIQAQTISFARDTLRPITALFGHVQGLTLNVAHYIGSSVVVEGQEHSPIIFHAGRRITFQDAVCRFVPPELAESQLREAEWAKSGPVASNGPQGKTQAVFAPQSAPSYLTGSGNAQRRWCPSPTTDRGMQLVSAGSSQSSKLTTPPLSWPVARWEPLGASASRLEGRCPSTKEILHSQSYAAAWSRLNAQLEALSAISGTAPAATPGGTSA